MKVETNDEIDIRAPRHRCSDFDADCWGIQDKTNCWLHAPELGLCPFLVGTAVDQPVTFR